MPAPLGEVPGPDVTGAVSLRTANASDLVGFAESDLRLLADVCCPVAVVLGTTTISVRQCLSLAPRSVIKLQQVAGEDLRVIVGDVPIARGEVVIVADKTAIRLTGIVDAPAGDR